MEPSRGIRHESHPLFNDSEFIPNDLKHVICQRREVGLQQTSQIVIPYEREDISLMELEEKMKSRIVDKNNKLHSTLLLNQSQNTSKVQNRQLFKSSITSYKHQNGQKPESIPIFPIVNEQELAMKRQSQLMSHSERYELCMILSGHSFDVFAVEVKWSPKVDVYAELVNKINRLYDSTLVKKDIEVKNLNIEIVPNQFHCSFRYNGREVLSEEKLKQLVFGQREPLYIGINIINSKFKYKNPDREVLNKYFQKVQMGPKIISNPVKLIGQSNINSQPSHTNIAIQFQDFTAMRFDFNDIKEFKIKFLLGMLKVKDYDRKGLMVLNKIFKPDQPVIVLENAFVMGKDNNFVHAKVVPQKQLFLSEIHQSILMNPKEILHQFELKSNLQKSKYPFLSLYLSQAQYPRDHNQHQQSIAVHIKTHIQNYFSAESSKMMFNWSRYIKTMMREIESLQIHRGWAYRVVGYEYHKRQLEIIQFSNFLVTTRNMEKIKQLKQENNNSRYTVFKIKSISGRLHKQGNALEMDQVIFAPYSSFRVVRKVESKYSIEYELEEIVEAKTVSKVNLLVWVDDKPKEGKGMFRQLKKNNILYPIYFYPVASNLQFQNTIDTYSQLFNDKNFRIIVISNMKRGEDKKIIDNAGVKTYQLTKHLFPDSRFKFLYYIGYVEGTKQKLKDSGIDPNCCFILNDFMVLKERLLELCNWEDLNQPEKKVESSFILKKHKSWENLFATGKI